MYKILINNIKRLEYSGQDLYTFLMDNTKENDIVYVDRDNNFIEYFFKKNKDELKIVSESYYKGYIEGLRNSN